MSENDTPQHGQSGVSTTETLTGDSGAVLSVCGRFRYKLWRRWDDGPMALFVMLNPSTADATQDDPTIRRCIGFARRWGMGGIRVCNLYALRATNPRDLIGVLDAVGEHTGRANRNDLVIRSAAGDAGRIIAAWGAWPGPYSLRPAVVQRLLAGHQVEALGFTKDGAPRHPLYKIASRTVSIHERKDRNRWEVRWREHGRNRSRSFRFEQDAKDFDNELYRRQRMGFDLPFDKGTMTLAEWGEIAWRDYYAPTLNPTTRRTYAYQWDKHVLKALGDHQLRQIDPGVVNRFQVDMRRGGAGDPTIRHVLALLQGMLRFAVIDGHLPANPVSIVGRPRQENSDWPDPVPPALVERILAAMPHPRDRMLVELVAYAGLRPGEALRAKATHIHGSKMRVHATKKTPRRNRVVDLIEPLRADLEHHLDGRQTGNLILRADGKPFTDTSWRNWRKRVWLEHGAPLLDGDDRRLYRMRGSFASLLAWEGRPITYVASQLGHSVETCSRYYLGIFEMFDLANAVPAADAVAQARATVLRDVRHTFANNAPAVPAP